MTSERKELSSNKMERDDERTDERKLGRKEEKLWEVMRDGWV